MWNTSIISITSLALELKCKTDQAELEKNHPQGWIQEDSPPIYLESCIMVVSIGAFIKIML